MFKVISNWFSNVSLSRGNAAALAFVGMLSMFAVGGAAHAQTNGVAALDVSQGTSYLQTNASTNMSTIAVVLFILAGLAMAIVWVKATFFG